MLHFNASRGGNDFRTGYIICHRLIGVALWAVTTTVAYHMVTCPLIPGIDSTAHWYVTWNSASRHLLITLLTWTRSTHSETPLQATALPKCIATTFSRLSTPPLHSYSVDEQTVTARYSFPVLYHWRESTSPQHQQIICLHQWFVYFPISTM